MISLYVRYASLAFLLPSAMTAMVLQLAAVEQVNAQNQARPILRLRADTQKVDYSRSAIVASGNVQFTYPARQLQGKATQALFFFGSEKRIVLSGNVDVLAEGKRLQAETVTCLLHTGQCTPGANPVEMPNPVNK